MLPIHWFLSLALFVFIMIITPGPNNIMMANSGATHGLKKSLPLMCGAVFGPLIILILLACGGAVLFKIHWIQDSLRIACFVYLLWLAYKIATASPPNTNQQTKPLRFAHVVALQWLNPKVWTQYIVAISLYTVAQQSYLLQVIAIIGTFIIISIPCAFIWTFVGKAIAKYLKKSIHFRLFNIIMATLLIATVLPVLLNTHSF